MTELLVSNGATRILNRSHKFRTAITYFLLSEALIFLCGAQLAKHCSIPSSSEAYFECDLLYSCSGCRYPWASNLVSEKPERKRLDFALLRILKRIFCGNNFILDMLSCAFILFTWDVRPSRQWLRRLRRCVEFGVLLSWRWRQHLARKGWYLYTTLYSVTLYEAAIFYVLHVHVFTRGVKSFHMSPGSANAAARSLVARLMSLILIY